MELTVVAEGAETENEVNLLTEQGVDRIQGFYLARPMPLDKLLEFYKDHEHGKNSYEHAKMFLEHEKHPLLCF